MDASIITRNFPLLSQEHAKKSRAKFKERYGIDAETTGELSIEIKSRIVRAIVIGVYKPRKADLFDELMSVAETACFTTALDTTRPAHSQVKYLSRSVFFALSQFSSKYYLKSKKRKWIIRFSDLHKKLPEGREFADTITDEHKGPVEKAIEQEELIKKTDKRKLRMIHECAKTEMERRIIQVVMEGKPLCSVAREFHCSRANISRVYGNLKARIKQEYMERENAT